ncbi:tripartite tricarboxylate transporter substrate-binding protein [Dankookia sp. P2]|uniref:tripartite tricarboxylate transporter substrate-binding protein n=1 Tax=Dankookia sp. P2 TaxID=3423955 RepID=UPI003D66FC2F
MPPPASARPAMSSPSFVRREGLEATHVPYRGGAQAVTDTIAGTVDFFVSTWPQVVALVRDGRLRCLGIGASARLAELPDVPTFRRGRRAVHGRRRLVRPLGPGADAGAGRRPALGGAAAHPGGGGDGGEAGRARLHPGAAAGGGIAAFQRAEVARWRALVELTGIRIEGKRGKAGEKVFSPGPPLLFLRVSHSPRGAADSQKEGKGSGREYFLLP